MELYNPTGARMTNAIPPAKPHVGLFKKHSTLGLNHQIPEWMFKKELEYLDECREKGIQPKL